MTLSVTGGGHQVDARCQNQGRLTLKGVNNANTPQN